MYSTGVCYVLFRWDMETVLVSGCFGARCSVAPLRRPEGNSSKRERGLGVRGPEGLS